MALRILWDEKETAILVDYYIRFRDGKLSRAEAIANASIELRNRAIQSGIEIDDVFRNENGIAMQMNKIEDLFLGREGRLSKAPQVFVDIVNKYCNDRKSFNEIIRKARSVRNDSDSIEEKFFIWLTGKVSAVQMSELYFVYQEIESFCFSRKILKQSLFETVDVDIISTIKNYIDSNEIFHYAYKKKARQMQTAIKYYYDFIKEFEAENKLGIFNFLNPDEQKYDNVYGNHQIELQTEVKEVSAVSEDDDLLLVFLKKNEVAFIDNRDIGGCLWIRGEHDLDNLVKYCQSNMCVNFYYKEMVSIFGYKAGWWTRDYVKATISATIQKMGSQSLDSQLVFGSVHSDEQKYDDVSEMFQNQLQTEAKEVSKVPEENDILIMFLKKHDVPFIDNRNKDGCLWIKGGHELDNVVKYCRCNLSVNFHYKEEGARTLNYEVGWWTRDYAKHKTSVQINQPSLQKRVPQSLDSELFQKWMIENQGIALTTSKSYASGINNCEQLAIRLRLSSQRIYGVSLNEAKRTISLLMQTEEYKKANKSQHNRLRASLIKYLQYLSGDLEVVLETQKDMQDTAEFSVQEMNGDMKSYSKILSDKFPKGYRIESKLDLKRFISCYNTTYGTNISDNDLMREKIRKCILSVGIQHGDRVFSADSLVSIETKKHLLDYVESCFLQGIPVLYYSAIFEEFNEEFLGQKIYDDDMLRTYLMHECKEKYIFEKNYMSQDGNVQIDPLNEIKTVLVTHGSPMKCEKIYEELTHFSKKCIDNALRNREIIYNTGNEYFHVSLIDFSDDELKDIAELIQEIINDSHFVSGKEMIDAIRAKYPTMLERFPQFSQNGLRDAIAYYLRDQFSFNGNIISSLQKQLSMNDVFAEFAKTHASFTLEELNVLKNEMNSTIYFDAIYENSLRVSRERFVSKNEANFDVEKTDEAIASFCTGAYLPLAGINSFGIFPYVGFPWNIFLLEHYVASYSEKFKLLHVGYNADKCVGAIVKKDSGIDNFNALVIDVLTHSGISLNKEDALQYLYDLGYLARRRFSDIDQILIRAKAQKG